MTDGVTASGWTIPLGPVAAETTSGTLQVASGLGLATAGLTVSVDHGPNLLAWIANWSPGPVGALVADLPQTTCRLSVVAGASSGEDVILWHVVEPGETDLELVLPDVVRHVEPADGATGVTHETVFGATTHADGVVRVRYAPMTPSDGPYAVVVTADESWSLPDLSNYGILVPPGATYAWEVTGYGPATVDDFCDAVPFTSRPVFYEARAGWREFTVGP